MKRVVEALYEQVIVSFQQAKSERRDLYDLGWNAGSAELDLLGDVELYGDAIAGLSTHISRRRGPADRAAILSKLEAASLFAYPALTDFVLTRGERYPKLQRHLLLLECLRSACLVALSDSIEESG
ncbi:MAG: hypothetical protein H6704_24250 [Myxococcales bacterium]|nr:hypothetical protein [Myxococcales bacterium]